MSRYYADIETNGLLDTCTKCWIVFLRDIDTGKKQYWLEGDLGWQEVLNKATLLVGHNFVGFDLPALEKLFKYKLPSTCAVHDTFIFSVICNYRRFGNEGHSLETWGNSFSFPKINIEDPDTFFSAYTQEMLAYCERDVNILPRVYKVVMDEFFAIVDKPNASDNLRHYIKAEHAVSKWCAQAALYGWPFNLEAAKELLIKIEAVMNETRAKLMPRLGMKTVAVDKALGIVKAKECRWTKIGTYNHHVASWFNIDPYTGQDEKRLVEGSYSRVTFEPLDIDSVNDVKVFLFRHGWIPTEYNYKFNEETKRKEKTSPKITEDSLECMDGDGKLYCDFLTNKSRFSILKSWIESCKNGRIHGECFTIGTPSMRARHSIIVNVPAADSVWGPEMRSLFTALPGWKLIGCDSAGNQARGLAHYLGSDEFIDTLLNGDIHQRNADIATAVLASMDIFHSVPRGVAKRLLYAFLFGAAGLKLWSYMFNTQDEKSGKKFKAGFTKAIPGLKELLTKLENVYGSTQKYGDGYIFGIGGNRIYCDSFHKLLVYLLQACEKATCSAAVMLTMERLEREGIPYQPCIMMHDEEDFMVPEEFADRAAAIGKQAFVDGPKLFGISIMDGEAKIGNNWYEVH